MTIANNNIDVRIFFGGEGGGGYFAPGGNGINNYCGGGDSYGRGDGETDAQYGGGGGENYRNGANGICIIQYYEWIYG